MKALDCNLLEEFRIAIYPMGRVETVLRELMPVNLSHILQI